MTARALHMRRALELGRVPDVVVYGFLGQIHVCFANACNGPRTLVATVGPRPSETWLALAAKIREVTT